MVPELVSTVYSILLDSLNNSAKDRLKLQYKPDNLTVKTLKTNAKEALTINARNKQLMSKPSKAVEVAVM